MSRKHFSYSATLRAFRVRGWTRLCQGCYLHSKLNKCILNKDALLLVVKIISKGKKKDKIISYIIIHCTFYRKMHSGLVGWPEEHLFLFGFLNVFLKELSSSVSAFGPPIIPSRCEEASSHTEITGVAAALTQSSPGTVLWEPKFIQQLHHVVLQHQAWNSPIKMIEWLKTTFVFWNWCLTNRGIEATACELFILKEK